MPIMLLRMIYCLHHSPGELLIAQQSTLSGVYLFAIQTVHECRRDNGEQLKLRSRPTCDRVPII